MYCDPDPRQRGAALVFALLTLLLLSLLVGAVMRGGLMQMRMARNLEIAEIERQRALTEIERVLAYLGTQAPAGSRGTVHCRAEEAGCDSALLSAIAAPLEVDSSQLRVVAVDRPPPRLDEAVASSGLAYKTVYYEVIAAMGQTSLAQGIAVLLAEPSP